MKDTTIIVTTHCPDLARYVHICYSIRLLIERTDARIIVVDNSGEGGAKNWHKKSLSRAFFTRIRKYLYKYIPMSHNTGMAHPKNVGMEFVNTKYVAFVDNDFYYSEGWLEASILALEELGEKTLVTPMGIREKYVKGETSGYKETSMFSPGCFVMRTADYGDYKWDVLADVPGRSFLKDFRERGIKFYATKEPMVDHVGYKMNLL